MATGSLCASLTLAGAPCRATALRGGVSCYAHSASKAATRSSARSRRHKERAAVRLARVQAAVARGWRRAADELPEEAVHVVLAVTSPSESGVLIVRAGYLSYGGGTWTVFGLPHSIVVSEQDMWMPLPAPPTAPREQS